MRQVIENKNLIWIDITEPTDGDIKYIKDKFPIHELTLKTIIPSIHHPDIDIFENYISIILHYPRNEEGQNVEIYELDIIAGKNFLVTSHYKQIKPLNFILEECLSSETKKEEYLGRGTDALLFYILNKFLKRILEKTDEIGENVDSIEKIIFIEKEREMVKRISYLKKRILSFWRAIDPQEEVFYSLKATGVNFFGPESRHYFSILSRINKRIESSLRTYKETIESLEETNHILVNLKMNEVIKILTVFSVVMLPLTLLASIWGMNTNFLPFADKAIDFWLIMGLMFITLFIMLSYFRIKKWL